MTPQLDDPATDQPQPADEILQSPEIKQKCAEIRALLPALKRANEAFGELHELLDEDGQVPDFDMWCEHEFGVVPGLLLIAMDLE